MKADTNLLMPAVLMTAAMSTVAQPVITAQPRDNLAIPGQAITITVAATTTNPPLHFQWQRDGTTISVKTNTTLEFTNVQVPDAGNYSAIVSDASGSVTSRVATLAVIGPVALDPKLSANIRLGDDPLALPANLPAQAEPHIARSFNDANLLVATFQEGRYANGGAAACCGYSVTTNGGLTWSRELIPGLTSINGGRSPRASDPVATIDRNGNLILNTLPVSGAPVAVVVCISTNKGATFSAPIRVDQPLPSAFPDKNWIAVNTFSGTPHANRLAVVFTAYDSSVDNGDLRCTYSDDGGRTWSNPKLVVPSDTSGAQPVFLPDGSLAVIYWKFRDGFEVVGPGRIELVLSQDGGETFGPTNLVQDMSTLWHVDPIARDATFFPSACADRQAGVIYVTCQGESGPSTNRTPQILFTKSIDKGQTWSAPVAVNDTPSRRGVFNPAVAASPDGQHVTIEFYDKRNQTTNSADNFVDLYLAESFDGGDTWQPNIRLSNVTSDLRLAPLTGDGRMLGDYQAIVPALNSNAPGVAVWIDTRTGNPDPYIVRISRTKGTTFDTWRKLRFSTNDLANPAISGENGDPDGDGIPNLAEYAYASEPTRPGAGPLKITLGVPGPNSTLIASYERLAVLSDIQFHWESSTNLVAWAAISPAQEQTVTGHDPSMERVEATFTVGDQMRFFRLAVTKVSLGP